MSLSQSRSTGLNDMQLTLLRLFNRPMSEQEITLLRDKLTSFYSEMLLDNVEKTVQERGITDADYERLRQGK